MKRYLLFSFLLMIIACTPNKQKNKIIIPQHIANELNKNQQRENPETQILYYYPGDCSICYGNISVIKTNFPKTPLIIISSSKDTILINEYMKKISYFGKVFIDSGSIFLDSNKLVLSKSSIFLINNKNEILDETETTFNKKVSERFSAIIEK